MLYKYLYSIYVPVCNDWLVGYGLTALWDSIWDTKCPSEKGRDM